MSDQNRNSDSNNHSDFRLPGAVSRPYRQARLITTLAFSYSGILNPSLKECHLHAPWGHIFEDLIDDLGLETFIVAQHSFSPFDRVSIQDWYKKKQEKKKEIRRIEQERNANRLGKPLPVKVAEPPVPTPAVPQFSTSQALNAGTDADDQDIDLLAETSFRTLADERSEEKVPDFSIFKGLKFRNRVTNAIMTPADFPNDPADWDIVRVVVAKAMLLAELKPPPSRHIESEVAFHTALGKIMVKANLQAWRQAERACAADEKLQSLVLVACVGEWWTWRLANRREVIPPEDTQPESTSNILPSDPRVELPEAASQRQSRRRNAAAPAQPSSTPEVGIRPQPRVAKEKAKGKYAQPPEDEPDDDDDKVPYDRGSRKGKEPEDELPPTLAPRRVFKTAQAGYSDQAEANIVDAIPPHTNWSDFLRLSTPASNQAWYLVHYFLQHGQVPGVELPSNDSGPVPGPSNASRKRSAEPTPVVGGRKSHSKKLKLDSVGVEVREEEDYASEGVMTDREERG
ncbi:unnamed protein product [Cyclocybe aegerita]|uniref:Uncharacterized protein n=1 Tax=Cyclocybe aegerita TaxID=1973307 RepID=A0A8S0W5U8_CYCAE|nr:unnamed protein product [Cyclocybe aegerita]